MALRNRTHALTCRGPKPVQLFSQKDQADPACDDEDSSEIPHEGGADTLIHDDNNPF